jgi:hypothetical protein
MDPPWNAWRPIEIAERPSSVDVSWCIAAGWALTCSCVKDALTPVRPGHRWIAAL